MEQANQDIEKKLLEKDEEIGHVKNHNQDLMEQIKNLNDDKMSQTRQVEEYLQWRVNYRQGFKDRASGNNTIFRLKKSWLWRKGQIHIKLNYF